MVSDHHPIFAEGDTFNLEATVRKQIRPYVLCIGYSMFCVGHGIYTTLTNFSTKFLVMCKVYTDVGGIN